MNRTLWTPQVSATSGFATGWPSVACYEDSPNNVSVSGGALHLTVRQEAQPFQCGGLTTLYSAGMVSTAYSFSQAYGRFEVRAQLPSAIFPGLQETLWLWPVNSTLYGSWPSSGEIDFSEFYSVYYLWDIPAIHYNYDPSTANLLTGNNVATNYCPIVPLVYNDYAVTWEPGTFTITINGIPCLIDHYQPIGVTSPAPFNQPFFLALTQGLGVGTNALIPYFAPLPATTNIQYVRVWK